MNAIPSKGEPGYMSCPRQCGVDVRGHNSSDQVNGGCDTGPMSLEEMIDWFTAHGVGSPHVAHIQDAYTMNEAIAEFYGLDECELERMHAAVHGSTY